MHAHVKLISKDWLCCGPQQTNMHHHSKVIEEGIFFTDTSDYF